MHSFFYMAPTLGEIEGFSQLFRRLCQDDMIVPQGYTQEMLEKLLPFFLIGMAVGFDDDSLARLPDLMDEVLGRLKVRTDDLASRDISWQQIVHNWIEHDPVEIIVILDGEEARQAENMVDALEHTQDILAGRESSLVDVPYLFD